MTEELQQRINEIIDNWSSISPTTLTTSNLPETELNEKVILEMLSKFKSTETLNKHFYIIHDCPECDELTIKKITKQIDDLADCYILTTACTTCMLKLTVPWKELT